ncbi:MAG: NAD(P)H-hydrate dehydratase [Clostridiales bacterium]|nr:NAD(P)H-hydrate dehydratase [Clostridiales bacterium]
MYAITSNAMRYMEEYTMSAGIPGNVLMELAGKSVAEEIILRFPNPKTSILILCGSGKNGSDGLVCARWLLNKNYLNTSILFVGDRGKISSEFFEQAEMLVKLHPKVDIDELSYGNRTTKNINADVLVDSIYGIGLNRQLKERDIELINYINTQSSYKISVDIPTGLEASEGKVMGTAIIADLTLTFGYYKTGMFFGRGKEYCGEVKLIDIGLSKEGLKNIPDKITICNREFYDKTVADALIRRNESGHKGSFGTVGIVVSSKGMLGASILVARSAYRSGCGLVKILCPKESVSTFNANIPEAVVVPYNERSVCRELEDFINGVDVVLIGPGLSEDVLGETLVDTVLEGNTPAVFDAGALNIIAGRLDKFHKRKCQCVLTPHLGEMARLCGLSKRKVISKLPSYTYIFSQDYKVSVVAKSDISLICLDRHETGNELFLNTTGNSGLATAGSGDVLAGVIASLIAQGNSLNDSLLYGVMIHGIAADKSATTENLRRRMMAGDIVDNLFL